MALVTGGRKVSARGRIGILVLIMTTVSLVTGASTLSILYRTAFAPQEMRLIETAKSRARLLEAIARQEMAEAATNPGTGFLTP